MLKEKPIFAFFWSLIESFSGKGIQFLIGIILARLLLPKDYGLIGIVFIFIALSKTITDSGFSSALIQKKSRDERDFSTVFYFNIVIACLFYLIFYLLAPLIAIYFENIELIPLIRVSMLSIIINSFAVVQTTQLSIKLDFKTQTKATLVSIIISGLIGIYMAYTGHGVWSLVFQFLTRSFINVILLWFYSKWIPSDGFHLDRLKKMFSFGSKLLASSLIDTVYRNIYVIIIGKFFSLIDLGFFTRAKQFSDFPTSNLSYILNRVTFPLLSEMQDDKNKLSKKYKQLIKNSSLFVFPLMIGILVLAKPLIILVLTEKWLPTVWMLQLLCLASMWYPIHALNLNILKVKGRSDLVLKLEIIKKIIITIVIFISIPFGIKALIIGQIIISVVSLLLNLYYTQRYIEYSFFNQLKDLIIILFLSLTMGLIMFYFSNFFEMNLLKILFSSLIGFIFYFLSAWFFKLGDIQLIPKYFK